MVRVMWFSRTTGRGYCNMLCISGLGWEMSSSFRSPVNKFQNRELRRPYVRFGSLADVLTSPRHVRFTPNYGRWAPHPSQHLAVGL